MTNLATALAHRGLAGRRGRSGRLRLGERERRHRQDPRPEPARPAAAARRDGARAHPVPHLHQGGGGRDGQPRVRRARPLGNARRRGTRHIAREARGTRPHAGGERARAHALCLRDRGARRGSRCRPSMRSASGCSSASRSRPVCRQGSTILDETEGCALQRAAIDAMLHAAQRNGKRARQGLAPRHRLRRRGPLRRRPGRSLRERRWIEWCLRLDIDGNDDYAAAEAFYRKALGCGPE